MPDLGNRIGWFKKLMVEAAGVEPAAILSYQGF